MPDSTAILVEQIIFGAVISLLVLVTAGVAYITWSDWRDRRRRNTAAPPRQSRVKGKRKK